MADSGEINPETAKSRHPSDRTFYCGSPLDHWSLHSFQQGRGHALHARPPRLPKYPTGRPKFPRVSQTSCRSLIHFPQVGQIPYRLLPTGRPYFPRVGHIFHGLAIFLTGRPYFSRVGHISHGSAKSPAVYFPRVGHNLYMFECPSDRNSGIDRPDQRRASISLKTYPCVLSLPFPTADFPLVHVCLFCSNYR